MKDQKYIKFFCLALSAITVISFSSCSENRNKETPTKVNSGEDVVLYSSAEESTAKKSWFKKNKNDSKKEETNEKKNDERVFCFDKKFFAVKAPVKDDESKYVIDVYSGETNELSTEFIPAENFTKFEWVENSYKLIVYNGENPVQAYKYNQKAEKWEESII